MYTHTKIEHLIDDETAIKYYQSGENLEQVGQRVIGKHWGKSKKEQIIKRILRRNGLKHRSRFESRLLTEINRAKNNQLTNHNA